MEAITTSPEEPKVVGSGIKRIFRNENFKRSTIKYNLGLISHTAGGIDKENLAVIYDSHTQIINALVEGIPEEKENLSHEKILTEVPEYISITLHNKPVEELKKIRAEKSKSYRDKVKDMDTVERSLFIINNTCNREIVKLDKKGRKVKFHVSVEYLEDDVPEPKKPSKNRTSSKRNSKDEISDEEASVNEEPEEEASMPASKIQYENPKDKIPDEEANMDEGVEKEVSIVANFVHCENSKDEILDDELSMNEDSEEEFSDEEASVSEDSEEEFSDEEISDEEASMKENPKKEVPMPMNKACHENPKKEIPEPPKVNTKIIPTVGGKRCFPANPSPGLVSDLEASLKSQIKSTDKAKKDNSLTVINFFISCIRKRDFPNAMMFYERHEILRESKFDFTDLFSKTVNQQKGSENPLLW